MTHHRTVLLAAILVSLAAVASGSSTDPVGEWPFDEEQGQTAHDNSSYGNDGTLGKSVNEDVYDPQWFTIDRCWSGACLNFTEQDEGQFVAVTDSTSLAFDNITIAAWVYPITYYGGTNNGIVTKERQFKLALGDGRNEHEGELIGSIYNEQHCGSAGWCGEDPGGAQRTGVIIDKHAWTHVAMTWNTTHFAFYVNGTQVAEDRPDIIDGPTPIGNKSYALAVGARDPFSQVRDSPLYFFDGRIDEPVVYNRALSDDEIALLSNDDSTEKQLSTGIELETDTVLNGSTFTVHGETVCETLGTDCTDVTLSVGPVGDRAPFSLAETEDTPASVDCGILSNGETCSAEWELVAEEPGTFLVEVTATSLDDLIDSNVSSAEITVVEPSISATELAPAGTSSQFSPRFTYESNVAADVRCTLNDLDVCRTRVNPTGGKTADGDCAFSSASYKERNTISCHLENKTFDVTESVRTDFVIDGDVTGVDVPDYARPGDRVEVVCTVRNHAPITLDIDTAVENHAYLTAALTGPDDTQATASLGSGTTHIVPGSNANLSAVLTVPTDATAGFWEAACTDFTLHPAPILDDTGERTAFEVVNETSNTTDTNTTEIQELHLRIIEPEQDAEVYVGDTVPVVVVVRDGDGRLVDDASVRINGERMEAAGHGEYYHDLRIRDMSDDQVSIHAEVDTASADASLRLHPRTGMTVNVDPINETYGVRDNFTVTGTVSTHRETHGLEVTGWFVDPDGNRRRIGATAVADNRFALSGTIPADMSGEQVEVIVRAEDRYEQAQDSTTLRVEEAPKGDFFLSFRAPDPESPVRSVAQGQAFDLRVRPIDIDSERSVRLDALHCVFGDEQQRIDTTWKDGEYTATVHVGENSPLGVQKVSCEGERAVHGTAFTADRAVTIQVFEQELQVDVLNADDLEPGQENTIRVRVADGNRTVENATVTVALDGESEEVNVTRQEDGTYTGEVYIPPETETVDVRAASAEGNLGGMQVVMDEPGGINPVWVAMIVLIFLAVMGVMFYRFRTQTVQEKITDLERRKQSIEQSMKDAEKKYYKRKLDKDTYTQMMEEYEQKKTQLTNELNQLRNESGESPENN